MNNGVIKNRSNFYHGGDLGDTVYAIPALRRLAVDTHLTLYPNHGVTRVLMDEVNANILIPLLNVQNHISADWKPTYDPTGLRLDFGVRRFYRDGFNLADMHSNWVGHDHWHVDHPWLVVDHPEMESPYKIVVARSARYRNDHFPWRELVRQFQGRACFVGVDWEHEDFQQNFGPIPRVRTHSLLEAARVMAAADIVIANQSCPRAVAEGLKMPVIVEVGRPNNTHFGRTDAWYPAHCTGLPDLSPNGLRRHWIESATKREMGHSPYNKTTLEEIARLCYLARSVPGYAIELGAKRGGTTAMIAWCLQRPVYLCDDFEKMEPDERKNMEHFLSVYHVRFTHGFPPPTGDEQFAFAHITNIGPKVFSQVEEWLLPRMSPGGIVVFNGTSIREVEKHLPKLGRPEPVDSNANVAGLYTYRIEG